jgi:hypothetical protein
LTQKSRVNKVRKRLIERELEIYRNNDSPYYHKGNAVLIALCAFSLAVFVVQREFLRHLNRKKEREWSTMSAVDKITYQTDLLAREREGNQRLDFRFKY